MSNLTDCFITNSSAQRREWWQAYSADTTDADARSLAARKFDVLPERIELRRNGGCVLARVKETDEYK